MVKKEFVKLKLSDDSEKNFIILIGENAKENSILVKNSEPTDIWFHFENISGPHIVLQNDDYKHTITEHSLYIIGNMLFKYKKRALQNEKIIYTFIKDLRLCKTPGLVIPYNTKFTNYQCH